MQRPKERYDIDLTYHPQILYDNIQYKYILNIVNHFTKYLVSIPNKK